MTVEPLNIAHAPSPVLEKSSVPEEEPHVHKLKEVSRCQIPHSLNFNGACVAKRLAGLNKCTNLCKAIDLNNPDIDQTLEV